MSKKIKKIIAREELIFLGIAGVYLIFQAIIPGGTGRRGGPSYADEVVYTRIGELGTKLILLGYLLYLLFKFVIWAIKILRGKE